MNFGELMKTKKNIDVKFKPDDYSHRIIRETEPNPNTGSSEFRVHLIERDLDYIFEHLPAIENGVDEIIARLIKTRKKQKISLPLPIEYEKEFSGRVILRMTPVLHQKPYIESKQTGVSK